MAEELEKRSDEKLGSYLARVREERKLTLEELARTSGVNIHYIESIEASDWKAFSIEAYLRSYVNSVSTRLGLDSKEVLDCLSKEIGSNYAHEFDALEPHRDFVAAPKKEAPKSKAKLIVIVVLLILILGALAAVLKLSDVQVSLNTEVKEQTENIVADESLESAPGPEGAEAVAPDTTSAATEDEAVRRAVDSVAAAKDLPASATIFISSDSKKKEEAEAAEVKKVTGPSKIELVANGKDSTWLGVKKSASSDYYNKQGKFSKAGDRLSYSAKDTLYVLIGNPAAIAEMKINDVATKLPTGAAGRALRFRVINGKVLGGF